MKNIYKQLMSFIHKKSKENELMAEIKAASKNPDDLKIYVFFRNFSIYFSYVFIKLKLSPNLLSTTWLLLLIGASISFSFNYNRLGGVLILMHFIIDCCDGEVARVTKKMSKAGNDYERIIHWSTNLFLLLGISIGLGNRYGSENVYLLCLFSLVFDSCFYYLTDQFYHIIRRNHNYVQLFKIGKYVFLFMPTSTILFMLGGFFDLLIYSIIIWTIISFTLFFLFAILYFKEEFKYRPIKQDSPPNDL
ncbi:CDP-alcohol phosphatidyltransferase family protein [Pedobacter gandavensis]|uniref:CDP-alcohol phosphatidyltransferase family protein n=1 Tax=Pedobacter gandavensis TaxID=2679963 RepID=UPI0024793749|nr:CDP-alcohol phosphatidyltransferase family protein [Pedobacter gandavensis]WGQ10947.1 CDP-alcohol phosphatidyltransferase family protein [Pedobacter gandavensis]